MRSVKDYEDVKRVLLEARQKAEASGDIDLRRDLSGATLAWKAHRRERVRAFAWGIAAWSCVLTLAAYGIAAAIQRAL